MQVSEYETTCLNTKLVSSLFFTTTILDPSSLLVLYIYNVYLITVACDGAAFFLCLSNLYLHKQPPSFRFTLPQ